MNFYKHHLGDYDADTAHLTWLEDMAYTRLMRLYYRREQAIPADISQACRLVRASSKQEREAVAAVLNEFFTLADDGWRNKRCDEEIDEADESGQEREAKNENEKERQRRHRAERKKLFEALREHDIVPAWDTKMDTLREMLCHVSRNVTATEPVIPVTRTATANQTPDSRLQTPIKPRVGRAARLPEGWTLPPEWSDWAREARPDLIPNLVAEKFADYWHGLAGSKGTKLDWFATWRNWIRAESEVKKANGHGSPISWDRTKEGIESKGREMNMFARGTEDHWSFAERIRQKLREAQHA